MSEHQPAVGVRERNLQRFLLGSLMEVASPCYCAAEGGGDASRQAGAALTCRLLLWRRGLQRRLIGSHRDQQSKKLQSSSLLQFWSRRSLIFGSKKAMSTSMATTCGKAGGPVGIVSTGSVDGPRWFLTVRSFLMAKFSGLMSHRWSLWVKSLSKCDTMSRKLNAIRWTISLEVLLPRDLGLSGPETATSSSEKMFWSQVCPADRYSTA